MSHQPYTVQQLRSIVLYNLDNGLVDSAEFAAERLLAEAGDSDPDSIHLYSLVLLKKLRYKAAYNATANVQHPGCAYVFAKAALELEQGTEGVYALTSTQHLWECLPDKLSSNYEFERQLMPDPAVYYNLLGQLYFQIGDTKESAINHSKALKRNPFLWDSFQELNKMGANVRVKAIYKLAKESSGFALGNDTTEGFDSRDPFGEASTNVQPIKSFPKTIDETPKSRSSALGDFETPRIKPPTVPGAPTRRLRSSSIGRDNTFKAPPPLPGTETIKRAPRATASKVTSRLITQPLARANKSSVNTAAGIKGSVGDSVQKRSKPVLSEPSSHRKFMSNEELGEQHLLNLYSTYAKGFKAMSRYDCFKAIRILNTLPASHLKTPWVLSKLGRLHFEIVNYEESEAYFQKLRKVDSTRIEDMEYYSTLLWHLHKDVELCHLAHEVLNIDRNAPQSWVVVGNLFSINREPDEAIKCFRRATQLDEKHSYAYTLQGHEYVSNDAYEHALECFRFALLMDPRHYNALYGIGMVYLKLGNFNKAEFHFRKALDINPINVILICCLGMMLEKLGQRENALHQYELACKIQPLSALALFKKAQLLLSMEQYGAALSDFEHLATIAPDEASVHYLLGQLYKLANKKQDAIKQFTIALNLDPKGSQLVKEALEGLSA